MDLQEKLEKFIREYYYSDLLKALKEERALIIDFSVLDRFDALLADELLEQPERLLAIFNTAAASAADADERINLRVRNLPESRNIRIRNLRAVHLNRLWTVNAVIRGAGEVKPQIYEAIFECPDCKAKISVIQNAKILQKPSVCECGRRGDFNMVDKKMFDVRWLKAQEPFEVTSGEQPGEIGVTLKEDLTTPRMQKKTDPGSNLTIVGILKEVPKHIKGKLGTNMDMILEANHVETSQVEFEELEITPEDERTIKEIAANPNIYEMLRTSIAPGIFGFDDIKDAVVLQLFGGQVHVLPDGSRIRGNLHILITGDPGMGKSVIGSSRILHNSDEKPEYTTIEKLIDRALEKDKMLYNSAEISLKNNENIQVLSLNPKTMRVEWQPVTAFIRHESPEYLVKIMTKSGREVVATEDHSFVLMNGFGDLENLKGGSVKKGNFMPLSLNTHKEMLNEIKIGQVIRTNALELPKSLKLDWNFGFFMGMFISEGSIQQGDVRIESRNLDRKLKMKEFVDGLKLNAKINDKYIRFSSRSVVKFLEMSCYKGEKIRIGKGSGAERKCIPDFCFFAPKNFIYGLLSGLFSGDGYYTNAKPFNGRSKGNLKVGFTSISENLTLGLADILSLVGVFSIIRKKNYSYKGSDRTAYEISVLGRHAKNLLERISMIGKNKKIERFSEKDAFDLIPCTDLIYSIVKELSFSKRLAKDAEKRRSFAAMMRTVKRRQKIGRGRAEKIYSILLEESRMNGGKAKENIEKFRKILDMNAIWDYIESVERIKSNEKYVYDLSVDGCETFVVNNLVVHNTAMLKLVSAAVPRGRYVSGTGASGAGLTATVTKNEALGTWMLEAGALILCNKGLIAIDEFDKMNRDDQIAMHEATSVETVSIAKASIVATLPAQTAVLAGANPKLGRFDPFGSVGEQINIPETLLSRFDLKFALLDEPSRAKDEQLADHIITSRTKPERISPAIPLSFLRKFIAYAKQISSMELSDEAASMLKNFYVDMRNRYTSPDKKVVAITLRQYEALIRLAEASARVRLDTVVRVQDAERAIRLMTASMKQLGYDMETQTFDVDRLEGGVTSSKRAKIQRVLKILEDLQMESKEVAIDDLKAEAENQGVENIDEVVEWLDKEGMVMYPRPGFIRKI